MGGRGGAGLTAKKVDSRKAGSIKELLQNMKQLDNYGSEKIQKNNQSPA